MSEELQKSETDCAGNVNRHEANWHEDKIKTLEMIQNIISRLANNSFALKNLIAVLLTMTNFDKKKSSRLNLF